jgi:hypothetical protein
MNFSYLNTRKIRVEINDFKVNILKLGETTMIQCMKVLLIMKIAFIGTIRIYSEINYLSNINEVRK